MVKTETEPCVAGAQKYPRRISRPVVAVGEVLDDCYELREIIGVGGMGHVYEAHDRRLNRLVAIKIGHADTDSDALVREARVMAAFRHPGLPTVHALGCHDGIDYVVMEYLRGRSLAEILESERSVLPVGEARDALLSIAQSLHVLHDATLVHRDLKPENIMMVAPDRIVLCDFGVSDMERFIPEIGIAGSPHYIAPEAALGTLTVGNAHLTDIYALGVLGFKLLTGRMPFPGSKAIEVLDHAMVEDPPPLRSLRSDIPLALADLLDAMMARNPADRPPSIAVVASRLQTMDLEALQSSRAPDESPATIRVLVVDDEPAIWELMSYVLEDQGYEIVYVENGERALREIDSAPFDIVITDKNMPELDGLELLRQVKRISAATDVIMITGYPSKDAARNAAEAGAVRFMEKPFDIDDLASAVAELAIKHRTMGLQSAMES